MVDTRDDNDTSEKLEANGDKGERIASEREELVSRDATGPTIVTALKGKYGVGDLILRRLSSAGLVTMDQLRLSPPEEVAAVTGLDISIVHNILTSLGQDYHLAPPSEASLSKPVFAERDLAPQPTDNRAVASPSEKSAHIPADVDALHEEVLEKLRSEAELEASVRDLKGHIQKLQSRVSESRARLSSMDTNTGEKKKTHNYLSDQIALRTNVLDDLRSRLDGLLRKCALSDEVILQSETRLEVLRQERRNLKAQEVDVSGKVVGLVNTLGELRRSVANGRIAK